MASPGLWTIRLLRRLPTSPAFKTHLAQCEMAEIWNDERLTFAQIFGRAPLEDHGDRHADPRDRAVEAAVLARRRRPEHVVAPSVIAFQPQRRLR